MMFQYLSQIHEGPHQASDCHKRRAAESPHGGARCHHDTLLGGVVAMALRGVASHSLHGEVRKLLTLDFVHVNGRL